MNKPIAVILIAVLIAALFSGCGAKDAPAAEPAETAEPILPGSGLLGGWTVTDSPEVTDEVRTLFDQAMEGLVGVSYEPEAYLATQVVAGRNHALFCRARAVTPEAKPYFAVVYIYEDLNKKAQITEIRPLTPDGRSDENAGTAGTLAGGWSVPESQEKGLTAFGKATEKLLGVDYTPVLVTGEQVVKGMNYSVLCRAAAVTPAAEPGYCFVIVYEDLDGNASVADVVALGA